jgi:hypothetical protein
LYKEALILYEELEIVFLELEREKKSLVMEVFGGTEYGDDSGSILNDCKKAYRLALANNSITEFDFRQYLFARQCRFLFALQQLDVVAERGLAFIRSFVKDLTIHKFSKRFITVWSFSAYCDLAEALRSRLLHAHNSASNLFLPKATIDRLQHILPLLYYNARVMLDRLGYEKKWVPSLSATYVFTPCALQEIPQTIPSAVDLPKDEQRKDFSLLSSSSSTSSDDLKGNSTNKNAKFDPSDDKFCITHPSLIAALSSAPAFYKLYFSLTERAIECYRRVNWFRNVVRLNFELSLIEFYCGQYALCADRLANLWSFLHTHDSSLSSTAPNMATSLSGMDEYWAIHFEVQHRLTFLNWLLKRHNAYAQSLWYILSPPLVRLLPNALEHFHCAASYSVTELCTFYLSQLCGLSSSVFLEPFTLQLTHYTALKLDVDILLPGNVTIKETFFKRRKITRRDSFQVRLLIHSSLVESLIINDVCVTVIHKRSKSSASITRNERLHSVKISPGLTILTVRFKPEKLGEYFVSSVSLNFGSISWILSFSKPDTPFIECSPSQPTATVHCCTEFPLIAGTWQYLPITIHTNGDSFVDASLSLAAHELKIVDCYPPDLPSSPSAALCIPQNCPLDAYSLTMCDGIIKLPASIGVNQALQFSIPVLSSTAHSFNLQLQLKYREGASHEKFCLNLDVNDIRFIEPWEFSFDIMPIRNHNRYIFPPS